MTTNIFVAILISVIACMTKWTTSHQLWLVFGLAVAYAFVKHVDYIRK